VLSSGSLAAAPDLHLPRPLMAHAGAAPMGYRPAQRPGEAARRCTCRPLDVAAAQPPHPAANDQRLQGSRPQCRPTVRDHATHPPLGCTSDLRHLDLQLALGGLHPARPAPVPGATRVRRPLVPGSAQEGCHLFLDRPLQHQAGSQPPDLVQPLSVRQSRPPAPRLRPPARRSALLLTSRRSPPCSG
jgi:hypothetical protein